MADSGEYNSLPYKMEIAQDQDEGGYVVSFPDLPGCITCADTLERAIELADDAKREWIAAALFAGVLEKGVQTRANRRFSAVAE